MADGFEMKTVGLNALHLKMQRMAGTDTFSARMGARASSGTVIRVRGAGKTETITRTAGENVIILRTQAKQGRDVAWLRAELPRSIWQDAISRFMHSDATTDEVLMFAAQQIANLGVRETQNHIDRSENRGGGPVKPVCPSTQARKDREVGPGKPPLKWTGQLYDSLVGEARRIKG